MINIIRMLTVDEGIRFVVYKDTVGKRTVGIGFNMDDINARTIWQYAGIKENFDSIRDGKSSLSQESAWKLLNVCVDNCKIDLKHTFTEFDNYPEGVQLALINLIYNMGNTIFIQFKTFISLIKDSDYVGAAEDLSHTRWALEVKSRAKRVIALLNEDDKGYI